MCSYIYAPFLPNFSLGVLNPHVATCSCMRVFTVRQVSFIFCFFGSLFFYIIIHLNTAVLETNIVTYLNIVRTKLTTLFIEKVRKLIISFSHCFVIPQMMDSS